MLTYMHIHHREQFTFEFNIFFGHFAPVAVYLKYVFSMCDLHIK